MTDRKDFFDPRARDASAWGPHTEDPILWLIQREPANDPTDSWEWVNANYGSKTHDAND